MTSTRPSGGFFLVVVDLGEFRVDHVVLLARLAAWRAAPSSAGTARAGLAAVLLRLVHGLAELHGGLHQRVGLGFDRRRILAFERFLQVGHGVLDRLALALRHLRAVLGESLLGVVHQAFGAILRL